MARMGAQAAELSPPQIAARVAALGEWFHTIFEAPGYLMMHFVEDHYAGDPINGWIPNRACGEAMLRSAGFHVVAHPEAEVFLCRPEPSGGHTSGAVYPTRGMMSAMSAINATNAGGTR